MGKYLTGNVRYLPEGYMPVQFIPVGQTPVKYLLVWYISLRYISIWFIYSHYILVHLLPVHSYNTSLYLYYQYYIYPHTTYTHTLHILWWHPHPGPVSRTKHIWYSEHGMYCWFEIILERAMSATRIAVIPCTRTHSDEEEFLKKWLSWRE